MLFPIFFFNDTATTEIYTLSLHDALPISSTRPLSNVTIDSLPWLPKVKTTCELSRSEEHTSELQSQFHLVCRLLLEKKNRIEGQCGQISIIIQRPAQLSAHDERTRRCLCS